MKTSIQNRPTVLLTLMTAWALTAMLPVYAGTDDCRESGLTLSAVHRLPDAVVAESDPDWLAVIESRAEAAVKSGEWEERMKAEALRLRRWATDPTLPPSPPPAVKTTLKTKPTGFAFGLTDKGEETLSVTMNGDTRVLPPTFPMGELNAFSRNYLFVDASRPTEVAFAELLEKRWSETSENPLNLRVVLTGGSVRAMSGVMTSRVFADQGAVMTRRLGLKTSPALVRLTAKTIVIFSPALNADGLPDRAIPALVTGLEKPLTLDSRQPRRLRARQNARLDNTKE